MSYIINKTDGSVLTEIVDGTVDQTATDLTLIGKNSSSYGEFFNENLVHLLENFANTSQPNKPVAGQLWFDTGESRLKVYDGSGFKVSGGTIVAPIIPSSISQGDIWIDSKRKILFFNDGVSTIPANRSYTASQGISGFEIIDVVDTNEVSHTVVLLYCARVLLGVFSKDAFTLANPNDIPGFTGDINIGFNSGSANGIQFHTTATSAYNLIDGNGNLKSADNFLTSAGDSSINGTLTITNSTPIILGPATQNEIKVSDSSFQLNSNKSNQNFQIGVKNVNGLLPAIYVNANSQRVGLYTNSPTKTLDVNGDARIRGSLTVEGTTTTVNTTNLVISDKLIDLGASDSASNTTANGGGIALKAGSDGDKLLTWASSTSSWTSTENISIATGKTYKINGVDVLSYSALGTSVTSALGLTSIGTQVSFRSGNVIITANTISASNVNGDIVLSPNNLGTVNVSSKKITNLAAPAAENDAVNYITLNNALQSQALGLSADCTGKLNNGQIATDIITKIYPPGNYLKQTICRIYCTNVGFGTQTQVAKQYFINNSQAWEHFTDL
jgi:hypothetical protein